MNNFHRVAAFATWMIVAMGIAYGSSSTGDSSAAEPVAKQSSGVKQSSDVKKSFVNPHSIPLPNGGIYLDRGICGAFYGGKNRNTGDTHSLFQWQGEVGYFYKPYFSGGLGFRILAGEPSDSAQKIINRYFINARFHKAWEHASIFIGPQLGVDDLNKLTELNTSGKDSTTSTAASIITTPIQNTHLGLGLEMGGGWKCTRRFGLTLGSNLEYSLADSVSHGNALDMHVLPGVSVDLLSFSDSMQESVAALYLNVEFQFGYLLFEKTHRRHDQAGILGISLAF